MTITAGKVRRPPRVVLYGTEGVGKTTFVAGDAALGLAGAPVPFFLDLEGGTDNFDVHRVACSTWDELLQWLDWLYSGEHEYATVCIDTASAAQTMAQEHVCQVHRQASIEDFGYGKGWTKMAEAFDELLRKLDALTYRGLAAVVLAHADVRPFRDPAGGEYDRWAIRADKRIGPKLREWATALLFADHDKTVVKEGQGFRERHVAKSWGSRVVWTSHRATHDAKNRYGLPEQMPLDWSAFQAGVDAYFAR